MDLYKNCGHPKTTENTYPDKRGGGRCRECMLSPEKKEQRKKYMAEHPKANALRQHKYRAAHPDTILSYRLEYVDRPASKNLERARTARRRAKVRGNAVGAPFTSDDVLALYGTDCHLCLEPINLSAPRRPPAEGWQRGLNIDHVQPLAQGGEHSLENCRPSHAKCNLQKGSK